MPQVSLQTVIIAIAAALITATASIIVALVTTRKHPSDVSSMLMNEALDLVESLRAERLELRNELASLRTEIMKCREEIVQLREENQKLRVALTAYGGTIDGEASRSQIHVEVQAALPAELAKSQQHPRRRPSRRQ